jgi:hypothetical protein
MEVSGADLFRPMTLFGLAFCRAIHGRQWRPGCVFRVFG